VYRASSIFVYRGCLVGRPAGRPACLADLPYTRSRGTAHIDRSSRRQAVVTASQLLSDARRTPTRESQVRSAATRRRCRMNGRLLGFGRSARRRISLICAGATIGSCASVGRRERGRLAYRYSERNCGCAASACSCISGSRLTVN